MRWLFNKRGDGVGSIHRHDAEFAGILARHHQTANGDIRARIDMLAQHLFIVHLVDMVARQNDHVARRVTLDDVDVLIDRIRRAFIPQHFRNALAGGQNVEAFIAFGAHEVPGALHVADEAVRLVLGGNANAADARIDGIRQRKVDNPRHAAEIDRRFGPVIGQFLEAAAPAPGQHIGHGFACEGLPRIFLHPAHSSIPSRFPRSVRPPEFNPRIAASALPGVAA